MASGCISGFNKGRWTRTEHDLFLRELGQLGKNWDGISERLKTRSALQVRTHAQKYFRKLNNGRPFPEQPYTDRTVKHETKGARGDEQRRQEGNEKAHGKEKEREEGQEESSEEDDDDDDEAGEEWGDDDNGGAAGSGSFLGQRVMAPPPPGAAVTEMTAVEERRHNHVVPVPQHPLPPLHLSLAAFSPPCVYHGQASGMVAGWWPELSPGFDQHMTTAAAAASSTAAGAGSMFDDFGESSRLPQRWQEQQQQELQQQHRHHLLPFRRGVDASDVEGGFRMPSKSVSPFEGERLSSPDGSWAADLARDLLPSATSTENAQTGHNTHSNATSGGETSSQRYGTDPQLGGGGGGGGDGGANLDMSLRRNMLPWP